MWPQRRDVLRETTILLARRKQILIRCAHSMNICAMNIRSLIGFIAALLISCAETSRAGSATWKTNPDDFDWNNAANWSLGGPPNGPADIATFGASSVTVIGFSAATEVNGITFASGASAYGFVGGLTISGAGITNNSGVTQSFYGIKFTNSATAGSLTHFNGVIFSD